MVKPLISFNVSVGLLIVGIFGTIFLVKNMLKEGRFISDLLLADSAWDDLRFQCLPIHRRDYFR